MENKQPFFSIIMPVFNTEKYLSKAINSILNQTFNDFELILIDDCSNDKSYDICKDYADNDARIKLLKNNINLGVAKSRNKALSIISGEYLTFVDSDDYVELNLLEVAYSKLKNNRIDLLKYSCKEEYIKKENNIAYSKLCQLENCFIEDKIKIQNQILEMEKVPLFGYLWNSFYKIEIVNKNNISFNENCIVNEDFAFNVKYILHIKNLCCINFCGYHYIKRDNSSLSTKKQDNYYELHMMKIRLFLNMCNEFNNLTQKNKEIIFWMYTRYIYSTIERNLNNNRKDIVALIDKIKKDDLYKEFLLIKFKEISKKQTLMIYCLKYSNNYVLMVLAKYIGLIKKNFPIIFTKFKG